MPIYEYECKLCETRFEKMLSMSKMTEPLNEPCPNCGVAVSDNITQCLTCATPIDPYRLGRVKPSAEFRDKLNRISKAHPGSKMNV
jgi:putative FmdB family regulatory protein